MGWRSVRAWAARAGLGEGAAHLRLGRLTSHRCPCLQARGLDLSRVRTCVVVAEERPRIALTQSFSKLFKDLGLHPRAVSTSLGCRVNLAICLQVSVDARAAASRPSGRCAAPAAAQPGPRAGMPRHLEGVRQRAAGGCRPRVSSLRSSLAFPALVLSWSVLTLGRPAAASQAPVRLSEGQTDTRRVFHSAKKPVP